MSTKIDADAETKLHSSSVLSDSDLPELGDAFTTLLVSSSEPYSDLPELDNNDGEGEGAATADASWREDLATLHLPAYHRHGVLDPPDASWRGPPVCKLERPTRNVCGVASDLPELEDDLPELEDALGNIVSW